MWELITVLLRTIFFYFFILLCYRIMGKREIGQLSLSDLTISILIAELVAISIENTNDSTMLTISPIILLVVLEILFAFLELKVNSVRKIVDGKPSVIINKGKINIKEMIKQRYGIEDLLLSLRENGIKNIKEVDYAILETNGILSVFKKSKDKTYPLPLVVDGNIEFETLQNINKSKKWLYNRLSEYDVSLKDVLYAFYKEDVVYIVKKTN